MKHRYLLFVPMLACLISWQSPSFDPQTEITAAQLWYQNSAYANTVFIGQPLQPDWSQATITKPKSDRLLIDVPLINGNQYDMAVKDPVTGQANPADRNGAVRLVITKFDNGTYIPMLFMAFGTPAYNNQYGSQAASQIKPHQVQANFSGYMAYLHLDGTPFAGLFLENGQIKATLTGASENSVVPRNCTLLETICVFLGEGWHCVHYIFCEVYDGTGGLLTFDSGNNWWWGGGPIQECFGCTTGGGYAPPLCPNGSLMTMEGSCPENTGGSSGECSLTGVYVLEMGPSVQELFMGIYPWYAFSDIAGKLINCVNGDASFQAFINESSGGVSIASHQNLVTAIEPFPTLKMWQIESTNYIKFQFTISLGVLGEYSTSADVSGHNIHDLKYLIN